MATHATLLEDMHTYFSVHTAEHRFDNVELNEIIDEVKEELKETIEEKHATIQVKELCSAFIIRDQFRQLMLSLLSNALKFSKSDLPPHIVIESVNIVTSRKNLHNLVPGEEYCHISVKDNGIGFDPQYNEKVFELFTKVHGKDYEGIGIGLSIVKKIVENHNGYIFATSILNEGTAVDIYIPTTVT